MTTHVFWTLVLCALALGTWLELAEAGQLRDDLNAFNGYTLETPLASYPSFKLIETWSGDFVQEVSLYENPGEALTLNGVSFLKVRYRFADGRLECIQLVYEGLDNRNRLLQWLEEHYGRLPVPERRTIPQVLWHGDQLTITLNFNKHTQRGTLWFASPALHDLVNKSLYVPAD
jgi:hypothetical protein